MIPLTRPLPAPLDRRHDWRPGDAVVALAGRPVRDVLDFYFLAPDAVRTSVTIRRRGGEERQLRLTPPEVEALVSSFAAPQLKTCACRCVFCFVDQNPPGLRETIYHKDEDWRFSWLYGNYVTLTSLGRAGLARVLEQGLSPLYVSVHATDPELRSRLLGVRRAPILPLLRELVAGGIEVHAQVVLVPGWNDGEQLLRTCRDLLELAPQVASLAIVPVGLTAHRAGLPRLEPVDAALAARTIDELAPLRREARRRLGTPFVHLSDEFYLLAGRPLPAPPVREGFPQLDNGIGLTARLARRWLRDLKRALRRGRPPRAPLTIVTGRLAARSLETFVLPPVRELLRAAGGPPVEVVGIDNTLFGSSVTVAGLLPGADLRRALAALAAAPAPATTAPAAAPRGVVALPPRAFNADGLTLDGWDLARLGAGLPLQVVAPPEDGFIDFWPTVG